MTDRPPAASSTVAERRLAEALVLGVMVTWAANFIVVKTAVEVVPPVTFAFVRFGGAALLLLLLARLIEGSLRMPARDLVAVLLLGTIGFGIYQILWTTALIHTAAGTSSLLIATAPIFTMLLAGLIGTDTLTLPKGLGALVSFVGVGLIVAAGSGLELGSGLLGDAMTLAAAVLWGIYMSFGAPFLRRHSPLLTTAWAMVGGSIALAPLGLAQLGSLRPGDVTPGVVLAILYSGLVAAALANVVVFRGVALLGPTRVVNLQFLVPAIAVVLAAVVLAEPIHPAQAIGGLAIVVGIAIARRGRAPGGPGPGRRAPERPASPIEAEQIEPA